MMYAIHKATKRHFDITGNLHASYACAGDDWRIVMGDDDGWIKWEPPKRGSNSPLPDDASVEVLLIRGHRHKGKASDFPWFDTGDGGTVEFYRPILDDDTKLEPPAWDGEGARPPVGVPIESKHKDATPEWANPDFHETTIVAMGKHLAIFTHPGSDHETVGRIDDYEFRPIRSEEDRSVEAAAKIIAGQFDATLEDCLGAARALCRAGMRLPKETPNAGFPR